MSKYEKIWNWNWFRFLFSMQYLACTIHIVFCDMIFSIFLFFLQSEITIEFFSYANLTREKIVWNEKLK